MSRAVTSEEEILKVSCGIVAKKGIAAVNMRTVASECGIALGSLYNYFSSKSELLSATIEAVWKDIFQMGKTLEKCENIVEYLNLLFEGVENSRSRYPKFFSMHALGFTAGERQEGKKAMEVYFFTSSRICRSVMRLPCSDKNSASLSSSREMLIRSRSLSI